MEYRPISDDNRIFIDRLRGLSIIRVVLVHLGLSWFYPPYSYFFNALLPILFFVSGAVSLPIFFRARNTVNYFAKRLISVLVPYYVIALVIFILAFFVKSGADINYAEQFLRWVLVIPGPEDRLFPMGQIWFIRSLSIIVVMSVIVFLLAIRFGRNILLWPVFLSLIISFLSCFYDSSSYHYISVFNIYQPIVFSGFFFLGAWYYSGALVSKAILIVSFIFLIVTSFIAVWAFELPFALSEHLFTPTYYYIGLAYSAVILAILLKTFIQRILNNFKILDRFVMFNSRHAYSIFILHSLSIFLLEKLFGLRGVASDLHLAVLKLILVFTITMLMAIPVTYCTKYVQSLVLRRLGSNKKKSENIALN